MSIDYKLIGKRIKTKRQHIGLTQEKMAEHLLVSVGYVSQIERGISKPNLEMLSTTTVSPSRMYESISESLGRFVFFPLCLSI